MSDELEAPWQRLCRLALLPQVEALEKEAEGARSREDVENVHRMRVASRRARSALEVFEDCLPRKPRRTWKKDMRALTRALGAARDADVQIEYLEELRGRAPGDSLPGIDFALELKERHREDLQHPLVQALEELEEGSVLEEMRSCLQDLPEAGTDWGSRPYARANRLIRGRIQDLVSREGCVHREEAIEDHHSLRISAKRLRYSLEIFRPLFEDGLKEPLSLIKEMQEKLGDMHDCDVWAADMEATDVLLRGSRLALPPDLAPKDILPGLELIRSDRAARRRQSYREFVSLWDAMLGQDALGGLQRMLEDAAGEGRDLTVQAIETLERSPGTLVAVLGDAHGNTLALKAVLEDAARHGARIILNTGDVLGPFGESEGAVREIRARPSLSVVGNFDLRVLRAKEGKGAEEDEAIGYSAEGVSPETRSWLMGLPEAMRLEWGGRVLLMVHGSPDSMTEKLEKGTSEARLEALARSTGADIIVSGHSHRPMYRRCGKARFLNPGSVGKQVDGDPRASYALLRMRPLRVRLRRVDYDLEGAARALRERGRKEWLAQALHRARDEPSEAGQDQESRFLQTLRVYRSYLGEDAHTEQVIRLSTMLFGCMARELGLGTKDLFLLRCAAALHDIGWTDGGPGHHKMSLRMVMEDYDLPFDPRERRMVAAVARYHRKAMPKGSHAIVSTMGKAERRRLEALASLLRLADGLDSSHGGKVKGLSCDVSSDKIILRCDVTGPIEMEERDARKKGDLIQKVLGRSLEIHWDVG